MRNRWIGLIILLGVLVAPLAPAASEAQTPSAEGVLAYV